MNTSGSRYKLTLAVGALGVVYGDIGTSPLYALRECFTGRHGVPTSPENVLGIVSLVLWSLTLIVSLKYLGLILRADNKGEGGILALLSLGMRGREGTRPTGALRWLVLAGLFGAALLYGDSMLTPSLTVLGAMEGLEVATPLFKPYVVPLAILVLVALFSIQRFGTGRVGGIFGPVMLVWFATLAVLGVRGILIAPQILEAFSPHHAVLFLVRHGSMAFVVLGAVFLSVTGAEALYADMGHFGPRPIRQAWFALVFPGLSLNYLGEGALLLSNPEAARNPFFLLAPTWAVLPLVGLSTLAAVIASQAMISGAYSLTMQAIQMGYLPRMHIEHTSHSERGQIYMPQVNAFLLLTCIGLVLGFKSSSGLAGAYGIAVSLTMLITSLLFFAAARRVWNWSAWRAGLVCGVFLVVELAFAAANGLKLLQGGWFPLCVGLGIFALMTTWWRGRDSLRASLADSYLPFNLFLEDLVRRDMPRVPGTAVFLSGNPTGTPIALLHSLKHYRVLHERMVILTILTQDRPFVPEAERLKVEALTAGIHRVTGLYGFMEQPDVPRLIEACRARGLDLDPDRITYFLSRETILARKGPGLARWRRGLFAAMARNAQSAAAFFQLPPNRVVELGMQVEV
ncbi:MAG: potassium transporter Kup [Verrucomicrobia bacterium]|jgi:KUP system potassium uptake protein|nr:potassium transporter Kup [Verrucomicrobiota bacterium]